LTVIITTQSWTERQWPTRHYDISTVWQPNKIYCSLRYLM